MSNTRKVPMRQCIGCQEMKNKKELLRILRTPQDEVVLDATGRMNGRGAYICPSMQCFEKAERNRGIERSLKRKISSEVYEQLKEELINIEKR